MTPKPGVNVEMYLENSPLWEDPHLVTSFLLRVVASMPLGGGIRSNPDAPCGAVRHRNWRGLGSAWHARAFEAKVELSPAEGTALLTACPAPVKPVELILMDAV